MRSFTTSRALYFSSSISFVDASVDSEDDFNDGNSPVDMLIRFTSSFG